MGGEQTYEAAGVSIAKADAVVERIRAAVESTGSRLVPWHHAPDFDENDLAAGEANLISPMPEPGDLNHKVDSIIAMRLA